MHQKPDWAVRPIGAKSNNLKMQIRPLALRVPAFKRFPLLLIALFLCLKTSPLPIPNSETCSFGIADAAPTPLRAQSTRASTSNSAKTHREIELVSSTSQGVTIQLVIPKSDFLYISHQPSAVSGRFPESLEVSNVAGPMLSFPGCNFTTEPGMPHLPMQSTLISVPPDVDFQLRVIDKNFSTHKIEATAVHCRSEFCSRYRRWIFPTTARRNRKSRLDPREPRPPNPTESCPVQSCPP